MQHTKVMRDHTEKSKYSLLIALQTHFVTAHLALTLFI